MKNAKYLSILLVLGLFASIQAFPFVRAQDEQPVVQVDLPVNEENITYLPLISKGFPIDSIFGIEMSYELQLDGQDGPASLMRQAGTNWVRTNGLQWSVVEPSPGMRQWDLEIDRRVKVARQYQMQPVLIIRSTPLWAQLISGKYCGPIKPDALDDFANFMRDVVTRYSAYPYGVQYYEIWNEPDIDPKFFGEDSIYGCWGNEKDPYYGGRYYGEMLKWVYPAIKQANPNAQVLVGGLLLDCDPTNPPAGKDCTPSKFLEGILVNGAGYAFDGVSYHGYDYFTKPADINNPSNGLGVYSNGNWASSWKTTGPVSIAKANFIRNVLNQYGVTGKYVINSESALICGSSGNEPYCDSNSPQTSLAYQNSKAYYAVQAYAAARWLNLRANIWYSYNGWRGSGFYNWALNKLEVVYNAYNFTRSQIDSTTSASQISPAPNVIGYQFLRQGKRIQVIWYVGGDPSDGTLTTQVDLGSTPTAVWRWQNADNDISTVNDGAYQPAEVNQTISVGRAPVFIELTP
jgi:CDGSH-type Zn-finger protein